MKNYKIPSITECYNIMHEKMPQHIIEHSEQVMKVAISITDNLRTGVYIDKELVIAASLLHDITKNESLITHEHHDITGSKLLIGYGYDKVAEIIEEHVELKGYDLNKELREKEIVFYSDKRVTHNKIVTVDERISDLIVRYGKTDEIKEHILNNKKSIIDIEKKINSYMKCEINKVIFNLK